jgi:predicted oxidoreductase (fatty acid repression mutant protein)
VPQAIFQQDQVYRRNAVAAAEEGAGLQQANGLFPAAIRDVRRVWQGIQLLAQLDISSNTRPAV